MERYVIHIFHRDPDDPKKIIGAVEGIRGHGRVGFLGTNALLKILAPPGGVCRGKPGGTRKAGEEHDFKRFSEIMDLLREEQETSQEETPE